MALFSVGRSICRPLEFPRNNEVSANKIHIIVSIQFRILRIILAFFIEEKEEEYPGETND